MRRVAEKVVFKYIARLKDWVQGGEDTRAGVDLGQVSVVVTTEPGGEIRGGERCEGSSVHSVLQCFMFDIYTQSSVLNHSIKNDVLSIQSHVVVTGVAGPGTDTPGHSLPGQDLH